VSSTDFSRYASPSSVEKTDAADLPRSLLE
jgi:hypothetical protein